MRKILYLSTILALVTLISSCSSIKQVVEKLHIKKNEPVLASKPSSSPVSVSTPTQVETNKPKTIPLNPTPSTVTQIPPTPISLKPITSTMREFRAAWIASVANIDWPSKPGLSSFEQKNEAIELLDYLQKNQFNAVILQVRPQADAFYQSALEPWSYFLTGEQGVAPEPFYDPLTFWIEESHKRGLELHAWLNPYRAHHIKGSTISNQSVVKTNPELVYHLEEGYWWMDPALKSTQDKTSAVVLDIVKRYDVDGIHFDDYFYPYPSYNGGKDFPDDKSWNDYVNTGGRLTRGDWRRNSVNTLIERLYKEIKSEKSYVKFGLSPFGIYRPGSPSTVTGFDQYEKLYADAKLWLNKGWIDYFAPQLYWPINKTGQKFPDLLGWWQSENTLQRHLWPGINVVNNKPSAASNLEVVNEIQLTRDLIPKSKGSVHWNLSSLTKNPSLTKELIEGPYKTPALVPASPWLNNSKPPAPIVKFINNTSDILVSWETNDNNTFKWVLYFQYDNNWEYRILSKQQINATLNKKMLDASGKEIMLKNIIVSAIDRTGNESDQLIMPIG